MTDLIAVKQAPISRRRAALATFELFLVSCVVTVGGNATFSLMAQAGGLPQQASGIVLDLAPLASVLLGFLALRRKPWREIVKQNWALIGLTIAAPIVTSCWSASPGVSFAWCAKWLFWNSCMVWICSFKSPVKQLVSVWVPIVLLLAIAFVLREANRTLLWTPSGAIGPFTHRNFLGHACALMIVIGCCLVVLQPKFATVWILGVLLTTWWLLQSKSKTPLFSIGASLGLGLAVYIVGQLRRRFPSKRTSWESALFLSVFAVTLGILFWRVATAAPEGVMQGPNPSLSGRVAYWRALLTEIRRSFWTGYGPGQAFYNVGQRRIAAASEAGYALPHTHNGFLDLQLDGGVLQSLFLLALLVLCVQSIWRWSVRSPRFAAVLASLLVCVLTLNLTEPDFVQSFRPTLLVMGIVASRRPKTASRRVSASRSE